jgi:hypothetical protein
VPQSGEDSRAEGEGYRRIVHAFVSAVTAAACPRNPLVRVTGVPPS